MTDYIQYVMTLVNGSISPTNGMFDLVVDSARRPAPGSLGSPLPWLSQLIRFAISCLSIFSYRRSTVHIKVPVTEDVL